MATEAVKPQRFAVLQNRALLMLILGHFIIDSYSGFISVMNPLLVERFDLSLSTAGFVSLAYSGMSSISQPIFGLITDRFGARWIGLALVWTALMFAASGFAPSYTLVLVALGLAGIGSGAYHPMGAVSANAVIPAPLRNTAMSIYVTGGTIGMALGPLVGAVLFSAMGLNGTSLLLIPGALIGLWLMYEMRLHALRDKDKPKAKPAPLSTVPWGPLMVVVGILMLRNWTNQSYQNFTPLWYSRMGYSSGYYSALVTTLVLSSAVGAVVCGNLADRYGRKVVMIWSLILSIPPMFLYVWFPGSFGFVSAILLGLCAGSTGPLTLVMAQQMMAGRAGIASGMILGLGFITGAIGMPVTGWIADLSSIPFALTSQVVIVVISIILAFMMPSEKQMDQYAAKAAKA